jgi:hypothetical protein
MMNNYFIMMNNEILIIDMHMSIIVARYNEY